MKTIQFDIYLCLYCDNENKVRVYDGELNIPLCKKCGKRMSWFGTGEKVCEK